MAIRAEQTYIATIVFLDIVSYSKTSNREQVRLKSQLNRCISESLEGIDKEDLIVLDTGDGAALGFVTNPESGLRFAMHFSETLAATAADLQVRIGLHMGPITVLDDLNGLKNMVGDGINSAQRVMSFSNPGQIIVSQAYHDAVIRLDQAYVNRFGPARKFNDKHGRPHFCHELKASQHQLRSPATSSTLPSGSSRKPLPLIPAFLALGILAALGLAWQLLPPKQETTADRAVPAPAAISVAASKPAAETLASTPATEPQPHAATSLQALPQPPSAAKQDIPDIIPVQDRTPPAPVRTQHQDEQSADAPVQASSPSSSRKTVALAAKPVTKTECPKCDCTDLLTKLSMGTEPISPIQMTYLRQNCRQ